MDWPGAWGIENLLLSKAFCGSLLRMPRETVARREREQTETGKSRRRVSAVLCTDRYRTYWDMSGVESVETRCASVLCLIGWAGQMRRNPITLEPVLELDHRGREAAARELRDLRSMDWEVRKRWSSDGLRDRAEDFARHVWTLSGCPDGWDVTIERDCPRDFPGWEMVRGEWRKAS